MMGTVKRLRREVPKDVLRRDVPWADLPEDVWLMIISKLEEKCKSLQELAASTLIPLFWIKEKRLLKFSMFNQIGFHEHRHFIQLVKNVLSELESRNECQFVMHLEFPQQRCYLSNDDLSYIGRRLPNIQSLHLLTSKGVPKAIQTWKELRRLAIGPIHQSNYVHVIKEIGKICKNVKHMTLLCTADPNPNIKHMLVLDENTSRQISGNLSDSVKTLHLKNSLLYKPGLEIIMNKCRDIKVIIIEKCRIFRSDGSSEECQWYFMSRDGTLNWRLAHNGRVYYSTQLILNTLWASDCLIGNSRVDMWSV